MKYLALILTAIFGSVGFLPADHEGNYQEFLAPDSCNQERAIHNVSWGENLVSIGRQYGSTMFWEAIYIYNAHQIVKPNLIFEGQQLLIPQPIAFFLNSDEELGSVLDKPFCDLENLKISAVDKTSLTLYDLDQLKSDFKEYEDSQKTFTDQKTDTTNNDSVIVAFREAFESVIQEHQSTIDEPVSKKETAQSNSERQLMLEIDGMVHDETRSKVGRDFYDVFYTHWQKPPNASNFSIRIYEQPSPSLGTIIYVQVNDMETFRMRLQPRYELIQQAAHFAVRQTYRQLQSGLTELKIY